MIGYYGSKPRFKICKRFWIFRRWECRTSKWGVGYGKTPFEAYVDWMFKSAIFE